MLLDTTWVFCVVCGNKNCWMALLLLFGNAMAELAADTDIRINTNINININININEFAVERVTNIVNLQEDKDFAYWGVDFEAYSSRAKQLGMYLDRRPVRTWLLSHASSLSSTLKEIWLRCCNCILSLGIL